MNQPIKTAPPLVPQPLNKQSALLAQLNSTSKVIISDPLGNIIIPLEDKNLLQAMASTGPSGTSAGKTATKMAMDHQATLDKGLKMKIKRTKPGTKTSEAKHEIVKAELNGTAGALIDDTNNTSAGNKKHSQITATSPAVATTPVLTATAAATTTPTQTAQGTKRGSSGHRREKTREKSIHSSSSSSSQRDKNEHNSINSSSCQCTTHELQVNGVQTPCSSLNCIKNRTTDLSNNSNSQRINTGNQTNNTNNLNNSNSAAPISTNNLFSTNNCNSSINSSVGSTANTPGPPNLSSSSSSSSSTTTTTTTTTSSSSKNLAATISNLTQQQQQNLNSVNSIKSQTSQSTGTVIGTTTSGGSSSSSSSSILSSSSSSSSNSSTSSIIDDKRGTSPPPAKKMKTEPKEMIDMCVGTSVGTITEPDCLGPCEPGTAVTLEGIVWHETEGGVLVVNVTWRGKTYVGTLLDCTRHDWAPPR